MKHVAITSPSVANDATAAVAVVAESDMFLFCAKDVTIEINLLWCCCEIRGGGGGCEGT